MHYNIQCVWNKTEHFVSRHEQIKYNKRTQSTIKDTTQNVTFHTYAGYKFVDIFVKGGWYVIHNIIMNGEGLELYLERIKK